jgi:hypothetical protein
MAKFCKNCGQQLEDGAMFCAGCGTQMEQQAQYAPPPPPPAPPQEQQAQYAPPPAAPQTPAPPQGQQVQYAPPPAPPQGGYAPAGQPGYPPPGGPAYAEPKKKFPLWLLIVIIAAAAVVAAIIIATSITGNNAEKEFFTLGPDEVPSVMYVLGEIRDISGISSSTSGGVQTMVVKYKVPENQGSEMYQYTQALMDKYGFFNTNPFDFTGASGSGFTFAANSKEEGYILMVTIDYDNAGYTLTITRAVGTLTVYGNEEEEPEEPVIEEEEDLGDPGPAGDEIDLIVPATLAGGTTVEEAQANLESGLNVVSKNPDGSFTVRISSADQQSLIDGAKEMTEDAIYEIYYNEYYAGIEDIEWDDENFSYINFLVTEEFYADDNLSALAIMLLGYYAPWVQVYMGMGLDSSTLISVIDYDSGEIIFELDAPNDLANMFG